MSAGRASKGPALQVEDRERVRLLTLENAARRNALDPWLLARLREELGRAGPDGVRCVVLRGHGDKAFCSGYDIEKLGPGTNADAEVEETMAAVERCGPPVIAFVNGAAFGAGCELACACDLRVASEGAQLCVPPARLGIVYGSRGIARVMALAGPTRAKQMFFTGAPVSAQVALQWGLVDRVLPAEEAFADAMALANSIAANAPLAVQGMKQIFVRLGHPALSAEDEAAFARLRRQAFDSADAREGRAAFLEKRSAKFEGR
jgi:enoyl-CoA hydratase